MNDTEPPWPFGPQTQPLQYGPQFLTPLWETGLKAHWGHWHRSHGAIFGPESFKPTDWNRRPLIHGQEVVQQTPSPTNVIAQESHSPDAWWLLEKGHRRTSPPRSGNRFQCHPHHTPLTTKRPLNNNNIGPPLPLAMRVIMIFSTNFGL